jgi:branched-chain amino acid transport system substrate-binding protein
MDRLNHRNIGSEQSTGFCLAIGVFLIFSACLFTGLFEADLAGAAETGPIKVGLVAPLTGMAAQPGADMELGVKMALEEINRMAAGRKIELIVEDDTNTPANTVTKVRKLITHDKVAIILGTFSGACSYAAAPVTEEARVPYINTNSAADDLTQRKRSKNMIRVCYTSCQIGHIAGHYAYHKLGWRRVPVIGWEHSFGQEVLGSFQRVFEDAGGKVIQKTYTPISTIDFGPYVAQMKRDGDGLFEVVTAGASIRFLRALKAGGIMDKYKILATLTATDPAFLPELKDTALGVLSIDGYAETLSNPANIKFRERVRKLANREANSTILYAYDGMKVALKAIEAIKGETSNYEKFLSAIYAVEITDSPRGKVKVDKYGQVVQDFFIRRVDKVKDQYQNTVIETYPMVSQFWTYDPETFLKQPVYSRDNPSCKYCQ